MKNRDPRRCEACGRVNPPYRRRGKNRLDICGNCEKAFDSYFNLSTHDLARIEVLISVAKKARA